MSIQAYTLLEAEAHTFEEGDEVGLSSLLKGKDSRRLEAKVGLEVLRDFTDEALEREFADEEVGRLLVLADFTESDCSGPEAMGPSEEEGKEESDTRCEERRWSGHTS